MEGSLPEILLFGILAALGNILGGLVLFPSVIHLNFRPYLKYLLGLGAGFMLSVTLIEILPKVIVVWQKRSPDSAEELFLPMILVMAGYLLTQFVEHTIAPHFHLGEEVHHNEIISTGSAYTAVGGMIVHTFFDGVTIAAASHIDARIGLLVFLAVVLHKFPEGFTIGSMVLAAGKGRKEVLISTTLIGLTTLLGVLIFYFIGRGIDSAVTFALPVAAGVTLYVSASDLIPEVNHHSGHKVGVSLSVFAGVVLFFAAHLLLHSIAEH